MVKPGTAREFLHVTYIALHSLIFGVQPVPNNGPGIGPDGLGSHQRANLNQTLIVAASVTLPGWMLITKESAYLPVSGEHASDADLVFLG
jgi:hypothetical protein